MAQNRIFVLPKAQIGLCVFTRRHKHTKFTRYHFKLLDVKAFYVVGMSDAQAFVYFFFLHDWQTLFKLHTEFITKGQKWNNGRSCHSIKFINSKLKQYSSLRLH